MWARNAKSKKVNGITRITRDTYNTSNGFSKVGGWWEIRKLVWARDKGLCVPCRRKGLTIKGKEVHHIVALSRGGTTTMANLMTVCEFCHDKRHPGNHDLAAYRKSKSRSK